MDMKKKLQATVTLPAVPTECEVGGTHGLVLVQRWEKNGNHK
jgi:hypothetical protein